MARGCDSYGKPHVGREASRYRGGQREGLWDTYVGTELQHKMYQVMFIAVLYLHCGIVCMYFIIGDNPISRLYLYMKRTWILYIIQHTAVTYN